MATSNRIRELVSARGETFARVAVGAGINEKTLRSAANGKATHRSTRRLIAQYFGLTEEEVWATQAGLNYASNASIVPLPQQETPHED
jgi:lambda repressor-like predicted transcriptional regulator